MRAREGIHFSEVYLEDLCFDAQQAAEKAIKAVFLHSHLEFPYVHDLASLLTLLEKEGVGIPPQVKEATRLTRFAVQTRYPGITESVTQEDYERAINTTRSVIDWAIEHIHSRRTAKFSLYRAFTCSIISGRFARIRSRI